MFFTVEKIQKQLREIRAAADRQTCDIPRFKFYEEPFPHDEAPLVDGAGRSPQDPAFDDHDWPDFCLGNAWGGYDIQAWFRTRLPVPPSFRGRKLALRFLVGPRDGGNSTAETLLYVNGEPLQAVDVWHEEAWLPTELAGQDELWIALKSWSGVIGVPQQRRFKLAQLILIDEAAEHFAYRAATTLKAAVALEETDLRRIKLLQVLETAFQQIDFLKPRSPAFYDSLACADDVLDGQLKKLENTGELRPIVIGIGHAHIDMAWLWRLAHTREKSARTFTTALHLMRQYPEYRFLHSSPQLYQFLKEDYPQIFAQVKEHIAAGQWEINGGMWVEADTNLTSGESLVRQFLVGKRYVRKEFGINMNVLWLPDVFGYSAALPQIALKSGIKYFVTTKISWSQFNRFPYDTFYWRGLDGSELLTHFITTPEQGSRTYTYNGTLEPDQVKGIWDSYKQKEYNQELLLLYGWGDGGGGPTREMLESARNLRDLPGLPQVKLDRAEDYLQRLEERLAGQELPVWDGELYLEYHRGTYTSQAQNKRLNRQAETLYHNAEWLCSLADILLGEQKYPSIELQDGWERLLLNQFHDILPGSSIHSVYEDSQKDYHYINSIGMASIGAAKNSLQSSLSLPGPALVVYNPLSRKRGGLVEFPWSEIWDTHEPVGAGGERLPVQTIQDGSSVLVNVNEVPSLGYMAFPMAVKQNIHPPDQGRMRISSREMENRYYRIDLNEKGQILSIWDKTNDRQVLSEGSKGNVFQVFEDKPMDFDAWDIDIYYQDKMREIGELKSAVVEEPGPLRGVLRLTWRFYDSQITQRVTLYASSPRIDFRTEVDWQERQALLKVAFPVAVRATRATYDIQFGSLERPTHWNTSWDFARFETVGHKWADLSEGNYGVSLLNDCKYGYDVKNNVLRLTLIKSAIDPDPDADRGRHIFTYSLLPHSGDWRSGKVVEEAYDLNVPLLTGLVHEDDGPEDRVKAAPASYQFAEVSSDHVILETVKRAEDGDGWIVRFYENQQSREKDVKVFFGQRLSKACEVNLMEEDESPASFMENILTFSILPFEIKTFNVWFG